MLERKSAISSAFLNRFFLVTATAAVSPAFAWFTSCAAIVRCSVSNSLNFAAFLAP
jgi:hypothetical protein